MADEEWFPIKLDPWTGLYEVSNLGRIRVAPKIINQRKIKGYSVVSLRCFGHKINVGVHRIVAATFIRPPAPGEVTNHKNADRSDNSVENLEWTTPAGNNAHTAKLGRMAKWPRHPWAKINPTVAIEMRKEGATLKTIANKFGSSVTAVSNLLRKAKEEGRFVAN